MRLIAGLVCVGLVLAPSPNGARASGQPLDAAAGPRPLRVFMAEANVPADGLDADVLDVAAVDVAVERGANTTTLAYRVDAPGGRAQLHVRTRDRNSGSWRSAAFDTVEAIRGSVTQVRDTGTVLLVDLERDGLLGDLLVLDRALGLKWHVEGTLIDVLPDGNLLYRENLEEQRPAQPLAVSVFVPATGRHARVYPPAPPASGARQAFTLRVRRAFGNWGLANCLAAKHPCNAEQFDAFVVSGVRADARGHRFGWITRFGPAEGDTSGPVGFRTHVVVSCDRPEGSVGAACREMPFGDYDGPDGTNTRGALAMALVRRGERQ